ncbi:MAG TPA: hypothetical protein VH988_14360 [Thermoanaerobaculia bacterium]|nr:hypothetical protein [Thermoanaerobaculia bacterium]
MTQNVLVKLEFPEDLERLQLPRGVAERLHGLLDRQDRGEELTYGERREAEGLADLAELLSLLKLRAQQHATHEATVENGQIKLSEPAHLPEHARVYVVVPSVEKPPKSSVRSPHLVHPEEAWDFLKEVAPDSSPGIIHQG